MTVTEKDEDAKYVDALAYALDRGINFTEIALGYGHGQALALFKQALTKSSATRNDIFITHSLYTRDLPSMDVVKEDTANFYKMMQTDYADSTLVTQSLILKFGETVIYPFLHELLKSGKTRYVSLSNASPDWIRKFRNEFDDKFIAHEGHLSFEVRALQDKGVFDVCKELGIENIIWRPLGRSKTLQRNWPLLVELASKYQKTQGEIILNWICSLGYRPMIFSTSLVHIDENISAIQFKMTSEDYARMNDFRPTDYRPAFVDWEGPNIDDDIVRLVNEFDSRTP